MALRPRAVGKAMPEAAPLPEWVRGRMMFAELICISVIAQSLDSTIAA
jgi:hypothetical protein